MNQNYQTNEDQMEEYKQQLGLRKMLYKYQNENEQLKSQIKALTQRLQAIMAAKNDKKPVKSTSPNKKLNEAQEKYLKDQMKYYFKRTQQLNEEIKRYKQTIDQSKQIQCIKLGDVLKEKINKLQGLKAKLQKFKSESQVSNNITSNNNESVGVGKGISNAELEKKYANQLEELKKKVRELEKTRNINQKLNINKHAEMVNLQAKTRKIIHGHNNLQNSSTLEKGSAGKKGLWGLDFTQQNYNKILQDFQQIKKEKTNLLESINVQNRGLREKLVRLKNQYIDLSANSNSRVNKSLDLSTPRRKQYASTPKQEIHQTIVLPDIPNPLGASAYEKKNDKNFVPKMPREIEWNLNKNRKNITGFSWNDENSKSPITGINIWLDKILIGLQFIHTLGQTIQHLHAEGGQFKKLIPIQYRLNSNDYLQNIVLVIAKKTDKESSSPSIIGLELYSKNGRKDTFGTKVGTQGTQKFDFEIKAPEKPIYSFGSFIIDAATHISCINSLGFSVI